jgi:hypothetical protein
MILGYSNFRSSPKLHGDMMIAMIFLYMFFVVEKWEMVQYKLEVSPLLIPSQVDWELYPYLEPDTEPDQLQIESFAWR